MGLRDLFRRRARQPAGLEGVAIKLRPYNLPHDRKEGSAFPGPLWWGLVLGIAFYLGAHYSIATGVWPVHGTAPGPGALLMRDVVALLAWLILLGVLRAFKYQGRWAIVVLPILIFCIARPALFQVFTDPAYQAVGGAKARANDLKATRSRLYTIDQEYTPQRKQEVFAGPPPPLPDPFRTAVKAETSARGIVAGILTNFSVFLAPLAVLAGFLFARHRGPLRWFRDHRLLPFIPLMGIFLVLTLFFTSRATGKVGGTTPWELFLPIFIGIWAATLADDAYNLGQAGQAFAPRRLLMLFVYGALPVLPFVWIHELGLSLVLSVSLAAMLLVGTRRGWWAAVMLVAWLGMVFAAFHTDE
ncbi:MAG TPA: hypothetical protein VFE05_22460, partial [Longimicrobiaceae bacterium]|nr:hypothetical protein [Longimicrobiaceae bacterium]